MNLDKILELIEKITIDMANEMGADPRKHGMLRGTFEAALAEAQGAELTKVKYFTPANQSYNHFKSMRDAANALQNSLTAFRQALTQLRTIDPKAAEIADKSFRPLVDSAAYRINLAQQTEKLIIEIAQTGNSTRLQGTPLTLGRDNAGLVSSQLRTMNTNLVPQGLAQGSSLIERIKQLPTTTSEAKEQIRQVAIWVTTSLAMARRAAQSALTRAFTATTEMLAAFSARFMSFLPPVPTGQLKSWNRDDPSNMY
ncbi:hypothetical protein BH20ACI1_BH20ACI1_15270 [soil metagenome]